MRTFQTGGESGAFWNIDVAGRQVLLHFGRVGRSGTHQEHECASEEAANADLERRVRQKLRRGYRETTPPPISPIQLALEESIVANPDDLVAHMAYADWLGEQTDPHQQVRGEFIRTQLALEDPGRSADERRRLQQRERELLAEHGQVWLHQLSSWFPPYSQPECCRFARGWIHSLRVDHLTMVQAESLANAPELRLLRELTIVDESLEPAESEDLDDLYTMDDWPLSLLTEARFFGNVRTFTLGDIDGNRGFRTFPDAGFLEDVVQRMPNLVELNLNARGVAEDELFLAALPKMSRLRTLRLERVRLLDNGVRLLVKSGLLATLKVLQIWNARFTDAGARSLAQNKAQLRQLDLLDVSFNWLTESGVEVLRKTGVKLVAQYQMSAADDTDYEYEDEDIDDFDDLDTWE